MSVGSTLRSWFAAPPLPAKPAAELPDGAQAKASLGETGWSESLVYARSAWPKYNPDELMGLKGARVYRKMMTDEQVKAVVRFKRDAITGRKWYFEFDAKDLLAANKTEEEDPSAVPGGKEDSAPIVGKEPAPKQLRAHFLAPPPADAATELPAQGEVDEAEIDPATGLLAAPEEAGALTEEQELRIRVFEQVIEQMDGSFFDALNAIMTGVPYGFSMTEKVQKDIEVDGKTWVGIKRLALKPFDTFLFSPDEYGNIEKTIQRFEGYEQTIDMERFIHYVQNADVDAHYGQSELREAYRAWFSKDIAIRFWNIFLERYASGFLKIQPKDGVKVTAGSAEHTALVNLLTNLGPKTGVLLPSGVEAELVYPATTDAYEKAIAAHDKAIAKALLVPNLMGISEQGQTGSFAQSQTQLEAFMWTLEAETNRLEEILNEHLFRPLGELNFGAGPYPRFCFKPLSEAMKMQIIKTWVELVKAKAVTSTDADEEHIRELLDFPEAGEPLEISAPSAAGVALDPATGKPMPSAAPADPANLPPAPKKPVGKGDKRPGETVIGAKRLGITINGARVEFWNEDQPRADNGQWGEGGASGDGAAISAELGTVTGSLDANGAGLIKEAHLAGSWGKEDAQRAPDRKGLGTSDIDILLVASDLPSDSTWEQRARHRDAVNKAAARVQKDLQASTSRKVEVRVTDIIKGERTKVIWRGGKKNGKLSAISKAEFLARAVKRVDFSVIDNRGTKITAGTSAKVHEALRAGVDAIKEFIRTEDLFTNPGKIAEIAMPARVLTRVRKAAEAGLKEAWDLGAAHARRELEKAQGASFAADELRLADAAAQKFLESRSYTIAGDLADGARKKVTTILYNGIKGGWALDDILNRVEEELGATVLPHASTAIRTAVFEAINEARYELFASPEMSGFIEALEFSAILDGRTTEICEHMDERVYPVNDPVWEGYTPPLHFNCRSLLVAVTIRDAWERSDDPTIEPMDGFGNFSRSPGQGGGVHHHTHEVNVFPQITVAPAPAPNVDVKIEPTVVNVRVPEAQVLMTKEPAKPTSRTVELTLSNGKKAIGVIKENG
jgi:SPP1 gp7 family putative phage head morphogenesis protein